MDFNLISGGTDNHLILVDLRNKNISGKDAETLLDEVGITVNKNAVPDDPESPFVTSGIRIGTPAITSRGMQEAEMKVIAELISQALEGQGDPLIMAQIRRKVKELCASFPLYDIQD
jgi:glycine hydroxymethyltransferase